ncbi:MAG: hypothetical protein ABI231_01950 [Candidatus Tumulicola sp.]
MKTRYFAVAFLFVAAVAAAAVRPAAAAPSPSLSSVLGTLRSLSDVQFERVTYWARNGSARPFVSATPDQRAEAEIADLGSADRNAVLRWLQGDGRSALYDRGAGDGDIGSRRPNGMTPSSPTPNPYRPLDFASATLGNASAGHIAVYGGFAAAKRDGKAAIVCVSFKNTSSLVARRVLFDLPIADKQGRELGALQLDRRGEFSPGIDINGWSTLSDWQGGIGHRGYGDNCTLLEQSIASAPLLHAASVSYRVTRVEYADGSVWVP